MSRTETRTEISVSMRAYTLGRERGGNGEDGDKNQGKMRARDAIAHRLLAVFVALASFAYALLAAVR
jgi:hypothetical protein